jgi:hypothetical protein
MQGRVVGDVVIVQRRDRDRNPCLKLRRRGAKWKLKHRQPPIEELAEDLEPKRARSLLAPKLEGARECASRGPGVPGRLGGLDRRSRLDSAGGQRHLE